jgi:hypothetical protein
MHDEAAEPGRFGCPILVPVQWEGAGASGVPRSRCLIGWSLTDDLAVARCRATHAVTDCWKAHPERTPIVAADEPPPLPTTLHLTAAD